MGGSFRNFMRGNSSRLVAGVLILSLLMGPLAISDFGSSSFAMAQGDTQEAAETPITEQPPADRDADGIPDDQDECPDDPTNTCNLPPDADGDGIPDDQDECPNDPGNTCNLPPDTDGDGTPDDQDSCPNDPTNTCNVPPDTDGDGIPDDQDSCPEDLTNTCDLGTPQVSETPTATGTPTEVVEAAAAAIPAAPWQLVRLPFNGSYKITQGPQATSCRSLGLSHIQGDSNKANERAIDIGLPNRTPIYAAGDGVVQFEGWEYGMILARIEHPGGLVTWYVHLSQTVIDRGWNVTAGQLIGYSGDTGAPGAYHLHFAATQGASYGSPSVDLRGMPGFAWNPNIVWNDGGFISNCAAMNGQYDGTATGSAPPPPPPTQVPTKIPTQAPTKTPTRIATQTATVASGGFPAGSTVRTTANVNMRSGAGTGYTVLYVIASGTQCTVQAGPVAANGYQWYQLNCGSSRVGWVAGQNLKAGSASSPTPTKTASGFPVGSKVKTTAIVNMRSGAGTNYGVLRKLSSGVTCTVLGGPTSASGYQWYRLDCGSSRVGWVAGSYLKKA